MNAMKIWMTAFGLFFTMHLVLNGQSKRVLEAWKFYGAGSTRYDFEVTEEFCFKWDGVAPPEVSQADAISTALACWRDIYGTKDNGAKDRMVAAIKSVKLCTLDRFEFDAPYAYYQVVVHCPIHLQNRGGSGINLAHPVAIGKKKLPLRPTQVLDVFNKNETQLRYWW
jgi:hypothetical protein